GEVMWGIRSDCWAHSGTHAVWATANGQNGEPDCQKPYPNVTDSWLVYGPFSLANATSAALSVQYYVDTEPNLDWLQVAVSLDGGSQYSSLLNAPLSGQLGAGELTGQLPPALIGPP